MSLSITSSLYFMGLLLVKAALHPSYPPASSSQASTKTSQTPIPYFPNLYKPWPVHRYSTYPSQCIVFLQHFLKTSLFCSFSLFPPLSTHSGVLSGWFFSTSPSPGPQGHSKQTGKASPFSSLTANLTHFIWWWCDHCSCTFFQLHSDSG